LLSQFLSPLVNRRTDKWGGSLENRAEVLYSIVRGIKAVVKPTFTVAVKLNSADFQKGGFSEFDAIEVVKTLNTLGVDCIEISGGSYESPAMSGQKPRESTTRREAYFLEFAKEIVANSTVPIMLTGGISRKEVLEQVLAAGIDIAGMATALALVPDLPARLQRGETVPPAKVKSPNWPNKALSGLATMGVVKWNMRKHGSGSKPRWQIWPVFALIIELFLNWKRVRMFTRVKQKTE
jgi:2,4-dienoyl-CoA reductase-like NADH-dependent reductase (Old Yellow Enzyme family)